MFRYFRALWYAITGRFSAAADALRANKYVMSATYDKAIEKSEERFHTVRDAVAELMTIEQTRLQEIKSLQEKEAKLEKVKKGAHAAMQRCINQLQGLGKSKEEIQKDGDFMKHHAAFKDASSSLEEVEARLNEKEVDLEARRKQSNQYKIELQKMQRAAKELKEEKSEAVADVAVAQQAQAINDVLAGIAQDTTDKDLQSAREARKKAKAKAAISAEMAGSDAEMAESEYLELAAGSEADAELDGLLDWGDAGEVDSKADAKLTE